MFTILFSKGVFVFCVLVVIVLRKKIRWISEQRP